MRLCILLILVAAAAAANDKLRRQPSKVKVGTKSGSPCHEPRKVGPCAARTIIRRWYFSAKQNNCLPFFWGGCEPNDNNFKTLDACSRRCCGGSCGDPCRHPLRVGPCRADPGFPRWYFSVKLGKCLLFSWGGCKSNGNNFKTLDACSRRCCRGGCDDPCRQPLQVGPCGGHVPRWHFSPKAGQCLQFLWGGCRPNSNNFKTLAACYQQCSPCSQPRKAGPCKTLVPRWFFSVKRNTCLPFFWGGCHANSNNFNTLKTCSKQCCPGGYCGIKRPSFCSLPVKTAICNSLSVPRFYFDGKKCRKFSYGHCRGENKNNFETIELCKKVCKAY